MSTRERILSEALTLFSQRGFDAVSVRDIARAVGIKEASLYNHFANKQAIFDSILREYADRWGSLFSRLQLTGEDGQFTVDERTVAMYGQMTREQFNAMAAVLFEAYLKDDINVKLRKLLTIEQYRNPDIAALFKRLSFEDSLTFQTALFGAMIRAGLFGPTDPQMMALAFFSPIFLLFYQYGDQPERFEEAKAVFTRHIDHFHEKYGAPAPKKGSTL